MVKLKHVTDESWLVLSTDGSESKIGLLSEQRDRLILLAGKIKTVFRDRKEVVEFFQDDVFKNVLVEGETETGKQYFVRGYPVLHETVEEATGIEHELPIYVKAAGQNLIFAAGWYCLKFEKCWRPAYCPKLKTVETYQYEGPFKTKREMQIVLARRTREDRS